MKPRRVRPEHSTASRYTPTEHPEPPADARERILRTAYELFSRYGVQAIGIDRIVAEAAVAKMTLYRHFRSKEELVVATLELHEKLWTRGWLEREVERRRKPEARLLALFDAFDDWFRQDDYEGCLFTNYLLEIRDPRTPIGAASIGKRANIRAFIRGLAEEAGVRDPDSIARQWQILMTGSVVAAIEGDIDAARRARAVGSLLLERELAH
jgi:AcrR family transcriptional regulator